MNKTPANKPVADSALLSRLFAHDFRNILLAIRTSAESLRGQVAAAPESVEEVDQILRSADQARTLIELIDSLSAPSDTVACAINLNEEIINFEPVAARLLGVNRGIQLELSPRTPTARSAGRLLEQSLSGLLALAGQSVPDGARIVIRTFPDQVCEADTSLFLISPAPVHQASSIVALSGPGIANQDEAWGRALRDLALRLLPYDVHVMALRPAADEGAVRLYFPAAPDGTVEPVSLATPTTTEPVTIPRGHETVLVAEDDAGARRVISRILKSHGYHVLEAENGASAVRTILSHEGSVDLLLADIMMPDFDGPALARQAVSLRPGIKVIYASGFDASDLDRQHIALEGESFAFMKKPFRREELLTLVRRELDRPSEG